MWLPWYMCHYHGEGGYMCGYHGEGGYSVVTMAKVGICTLHEWHSHV